MLLSLARARALHNDRARVPRLIEEICLPD